MPGSTLPNIGITLPSLGGDEGIWDTEINDALTLVDAHDHTAGKGVAISTAALDIDADLTIAGFGLTNVGRVAFSAVTALSTGSKSLFVSSSDNELYWRTNGGTNVKLTAANALNVSAFTGGIAGDYSSVSAQVAFDDANDRYTFKQNNATGWARLASGEVRILETGTSESVYVGLACPAALAVSYSITFPTAVPGSTSLVQMSSAGVLSASNTVSNLITAGAGITCSADQNITVSGTGELKHGDKILCWGSYNGVNNSAGTAWQIDASGTPIEVRSTASGTLVVCVPFRAGDRVKSMRFPLKGDGAADLTTTVYVQSASMGVTTIGTATTTNQAASYSTITIDLTDTTLADGDSLICAFAANASGLHMGSLSFTYDRP